MYTPVLLLLAQQDIKVAAQWYEKRQQGLGRRFTADVRKKVATVNWILSPIIPDKFKPLLFQFLLFQIGLD